MGPPARYSALIVGEGLAPPAAAPPQTTIYANMSTKLDEFYRFPPQHKPTPCLPAGEIFPTLAGELPVRRLYLRAGDFHRALRRVWRLPSGDKTRNGGRQSCGKSS